MDYSPNGDGPLIPTYADFVVTTHTYKTVNHHPILADVLTPKSIQPGSHPLIIYWHGGALISGHRALPLLFPTWLPGFAAQHSAIVIAPDYRLLPEASATEIHEDLESLWQWLHRSLSSILVPHFAFNNMTASSGKHTADLSRILLTGASAGGYCALQQALDHPDSTRALLLQYPLIDIDDEHHTHGNGGAKVMGRDPATKADIDAWAAERMKSDTVVTMGESDRLGMAIGCGAWGKIRGFMGTGEGIAPLERIKLGRSRLPKKM